MSRTYRRCTNKKGHPEPNEDLDKLAHFFSLFCAEVRNLRARHIKYHQRHYYISDRSFTFTQKYLKDDAKKRSRHHKRENLGKILRDLDFADEAIFNKKYGDPWDWD